MPERRRAVWGPVGLVLLMLFALPWAAAAQSAIAGQVKDSSGAVMPGVTVEAASPALIEKVRSVVTDGSGQYKLVDLRPGTYSVTFSLPGFNTLKRDGIELAGTFTATVNADLPVGAVAETVVERAQDRQGTGAEDQGGDDEPLHEPLSLCRPVGAAGEPALQPPAEALDPESKVYARWTLHGTSHMLGMDVHDCGQAAPESYAKGELAEGMVLTVEPGLYFQADDLLVPEELRGIGIRIEDDVAVTRGIPDVLTGDLVKDPDDIERLMAARH